MPERFAYCIVKRRYINTLPFLFPFYMGGVRAMMVKASVEGLGFKVRVKVIGLRLKCRP